MNKLKLSLTIGLITAIIAVFWTYHYQKLKQVKLATTNTVVNSINNENRNLHREISGEIKKIHRDVISSSVNDNLRLLDQTAIIIGDPTSDDTMFNGVHASADDTIRPSDLGYNESDVYPMDNTDGSDPSAVREEVCEPMIYLDPIYGYVTEDCEVQK